jgi:hypothetical protein
VLSDNITIGNTGKFTCNGTFAVRSFAITSNVESTSTTTGAMQIIGGMGITESVFVGKNITSLGSITANEGIIGRKNITSLENIIADNGLISAFVRTAKLDITSTSDTSANIAGGMQVFGNTNVSNITATNLTLQSSATTTSINSGSLIVKGGSGITGNCHIGGSMIIYGGLSSNSQSTTWTYPIIRYPVTTTTINITNNPIITDYSSSYSSDIILTTFLTPSTVQSGLFSMNFGNSNPSMCQLTWIRISDQSSLLSYKNGPYACLTSVPAYTQNNITYYGSNILRSNNAPWISTYTYDNIQGLPSTTVRDVLYITSFLGDEAPFLGEFIAIELPYRLRMSSYVITFKNSSAVGSLVIESYPREWILVGRKANNQRLYVIDKRGSFTTATDRVQFDIDLSVDTSIYVFFALVITQVNVINPSGSGLCVTGLYQIALQGEPSIPVTASATPDSNSAATTTTTTYNQNLIGPTSFSGASTTITFGDTTTYGNVK